MGKWEVGKWGSEVFQDFGRGNWGGEKMEKWRSGKVGKWGSGSGEVGTWGSCVINDRIWR